MFVLEFKNLTYHKKKKKKRGKYAFFKYYILKKIDFPNKMYLSFKTEIK